MEDERARKARGISRGLFWVYLALLVSQGIVQVGLLSRRMGGTWRDRDYVSAGLLVLILILLVVLIMMRRRHGAEEDARRAEEKARRADWDRRGRQL
ncbi:hypothetical protein [Arthrobacter sp. R4-81]